MPVGLAGKGEAVDGAAVVGVLVRGDFGDGLAAEWEDIAADMLGVPVVARDETAELRAALIAVCDMLDLLGGSLVEAPDDLKEALSLLTDTERIAHKALGLPDLTALAGGENEK